VTSPREILQHAIDECARIDGQYTAAREEIYAQQRAALQTIGAVAAAMDVRDRAVAAAARAFEKRVTAVKQKARDAEADWPAVKDAAAAKAERTWQAALQKADQKQAAAVAKVEREYEAARRAAATLTGPALDGRRRAARAKRDEGFADAEREHREETQAAWVAFETAKLEAQDAAIASVEAARRAEEIDLTDAAAARDAAVREADEALEAVVDANPLARSIAEAFASRLQELEAACANAKSAVMARL
jgi:colicin import membrane protein